MGFGRLIRVRAHRGDPDAMIYVVAEADSLGPVTGAVPESAAQAHDRMDGRVGGDAEQAVPEREAA